MWSELEIVMWSDLEESAMWLCGVSYKKVLCGVI